MGGFGSGQFGFGPGQFSSQPSGTYRPTPVLISDNQKFLNEAFSNDPTLLPLFQQDPYEFSKFCDRHYFQSILGVTLGVPDRADIFAVSLSDDGACLNSGRATFFGENKLKPIGTWTGKIKTLDRITEIQTPFFKIFIKTRSGKSVPMFVLATEDIGYKRRVEDDVMVTLAKPFKIPPRYLKNPEGPIDLLIGLESAELLLREVYYVDNNPIEKSWFMKDLMLAASPASSQLAI